jgi:hypothetical protein
MSGDAKKPERTINLHGKEFAIIDRSAPIQHVDVLLEVGHFQGNIHVSLGAFVSDLGNTGFVEPMCRLRMSPVTAQALRKALDLMIDDALKPSVPKDKRN